MTDILLLIIALALWTIFWKLYDLYTLLNKFDKPWLFEPEDNKWLVKPKKGNHGKR